jgi:hypothetical protein
MLGLVASVLAGIVTPAVHEPPVTCCISNLTNSRQVHPNITMTVIMNGIMESTSMDLGLAVSLQWIVYPFRGDAQHRTNRPRTTVVTQLTDAKTAERVSFAHHHMHLGPRTTAVSSMTVAQMANQPVPLWRNALRISSTLLCADACAFDMSTC